jgi:hypothetical protein
MLVITYKKQVQWDYYYHTASVIMLMSLNAELIDKINNFSFDT